MLTCHPTTLGGLKVRAQPRQLTYQFGKNLSQSEKYKGLGIVQCEPSIALGSIPSITGREGRREGEKNINPLWPLPFPGHMGSATTLSNIQALYGGPEDPDSSLSSPGSHPSLPFICDTAGTVDSSAHHVPPPLSFAPASPPARNPCLRGDGWLLLALQGSPEIQFPSSFAHSSNRSLEPLRSALTVCSPPQDVSPLKTGTQSVLLTSGSPVPKQDRKEMCVGHRLGTVVHVFLFLWYWILSPRPSH